MNEHNKLIEICDKIEHTIDWEIDVTGYIYKDYNTPVDVREIIFTKDFMYKFEKYTAEKKGFGNFFKNIYLSLDDPVEYLYKLIN